MSAPTGRARARPFGAARALQRLLPHCNIAAR